jgi:Fe2+ or Zn2+ uptake regulation protein
MSNHHSLTQKFMQSKIKITRQRQLIAEKIDAITNPTSAEELYLSGLKKQGVDLATVYRNLTLFEKQGWLSRVDFGDGIYRYSHKSNVSHHHALICSSCLQIEYLSQCYLQKQQEEIHKRGYRQVSHKVEFYGQCPSCQKASRQDPTL